jgi:hypothetical protein
MSLNRYHASVNNSQLESNTMARRRGRGSGPNQSEFIRELFKQNPETRLGDAKKAWSDAGHKGEIGNSLFYVVKRKLGLTPPAAGRRRGRPPGSKNRTEASAPRGLIGRRGSASGYEVVEDRLDEVIRLLWELGDHDLVSEFRVARRKIAAKLA